MNTTDRRAVMASAAGAALLAMAPQALRRGDGAARAAGAPARLVCTIRHVVDPSKPDLFDAYARRWAAAVARCGGTLLGVFAPHDDGGDTALALVAFASLADYERFEARMSADPGALEAARFAREQRVVVSESRAFNRRV
jgi:NIPSNAP